MMSSAAPRLLGAFASLLRRFRPNFGRAAGGGPLAPVPILPVLVLSLCVLLGAGCSDITPKPQIAAVTPAPRNDLRAETETSRPDVWSEAEKQAAIFINSAPIYFHYDSAALTDSAKAVLRQKAIKLSAFPDFLLSISGHCDERGTAAYNDALGAKRARAALEFLAGLGIARSRLEAVSYGTSRPLVSGRGESVWSQNRRDEFSVDKK